MTRPLLALLVLLPAGARAGTVDEKLKSITVQAAEIGRKKEGRSPAIPQPARTINCAGSYTLVSGQSGVFKLFGRPDPAVKAVKDRFVIDLAGLPGSIRLSLIGEDAAGLNPRAELVIGREALYRSSLAFDQIRPEHKHLTSSELAKLFYERKGDPAAHSWRTTLEYAKGSSLSVPLDKDVGGVRQRRLDCSFE